MQMKHWEYSSRLNSEDANGLLFRLFFILFSILPIVESLNGFLNNGGNSGGLSIGIAYRLVLISVSMLMIFVLGVSHRTIIVGLLVIAILFLPHAIDLLVVRTSKGGASFPALWLKTVMPLICIEAYILLRNNTVYGRGLCEKLLAVWSLLVPMLILIPFILGIGFETYADSSVGYKGFFYSQNDLGFMLVVLYVFSFDKMLENIKITTALSTLSLAICILLIGLKSAYILLVLISIYLLVRSTCVSRIKKLIIFGTCLGVTLILVVLFFEQLSAVISRWKYFAQTLGNFPRFITSARIDRVPKVLDYLCGGAGGLLWVPFGVGMDYSNALGKYALIEMDFFDLLFLFGVFGFLLFIAYYGSIYISYLKKGRKTRYLDAVMFAAISMAGLAGHVLVNSALSAMVISAVFFGMIDKIPLERCFLICRNPPEGKHFKRISGAQDDHYEFGFALSLARCVRAGRYLVKASSISDNCEGKNG